MKGILGIKEGMTQVFTTSGELIPVTVVSVEPNVVVQIKTVEKDKYNSIQLGFLNKREKLMNKPEMGHFKKAKSDPKRFLKEILVQDTSVYELGQEIKADIFEVGEIVDVTGTSKGKGFQGPIKRHNQTKGPMGHGSQYHRGVGSLGTMRPKHVLKGQKMAGHMGFETITIQNLEIIDIDLENNIILIKGSIPGAKKSMVEIKSNIKKIIKKETKNLISYTDKEVIAVEEVIKEEPIEEPTEEVIAAEEVIVEEPIEEITEEVVEGTTEVTEETSSEEISE